ncbi:MAG TPA: hypothetical protein VET27_20725 [Mycobacterium sp.]|nr:hypothetical protein [Mycobacterium sp.]
MPTEVWLQKVQSRILPTVIRSIVTGGTAVETVTGSAVNGSPTAPFRGSDAAVTKPVAVLPETEISVNSVTPLVAPAMEQVRQLLRSW